MHRVSSQDQQDLARKMALVARRWRCRLDERLKGLGMSQPRWAALYWLDQAQGGISQAALAERSGVEAPALVKVIDQLESQGLVERRPSPQDRRVNLVFLKENARALVDQIAEAAEALRNELLADVSYEEFQATMALLHRVQMRLG